MSRPNYAHLADKYISGASYILHDRTYEGLEWKGPGPKPSEEIFDAFWAEEQRQAGILLNEELKFDSLMAERQHQARVEAERDMRSHEEKIKEEQAKIRSEIQAIKGAAIELQELLKTRDEMLDCWNEITAAQEIINAESEKYLYDTDFYVTRKHDTGKEIPEEITANRNLARERVTRGRLVYRYAEELRANEMPTRAIIQAAIKTGGKELERIRALRKELILKYPSPKRQRSY